MAARTFICYTCYESHDLEDTDLFPCGHFWCRACINGLIRSTWPHTCCDDEVPLERVQHFLTDDTKALVQRHIAEWEVSGDQRLYCSNPYCSELMGRDPSVRQDIQCFACSSHTCSACRYPSHQGVCQTDEATRQTLQTAAANHYRRCKRCDQMIERNGGCRHGTCPCGYEFCFLCDGEWSLCLEKDCQVSRTFFAMLTNVYVTIWLFIWRLLGWWSDIVLRL